VILRFKKKRKEKKKRKASQGRLFRRRRDADTQGTRLIIIQHVVKGSALFPFK
jgi:hypothetical protein